jgi:membrane protein YqaA with SNARE-associated domain
MWKSILRHLVRTFARLGGPGLLALSALDSSPLFIPFGNDLLFVALAARQHERMMYYALMATFGSVLGCLVDDALSRKGGEKGLEKRLSARQFASIKKYTKKSAAWALGVASLMPPPFPFTAFVIGAAALQYPRKKLLLVVSLTRLARFLIEGLLAIYIGRKLVVRFARSPVIEYVVGGLLVVSIAGSILSIRALLAGKDVAPRSL